MDPDLMVPNGFLFLNISNYLLATKGNMPTRQQKGFVRIVNFNVRRYPKNLQAHWLVGLALTDIRADR
jgi:hypothetical protein